MKTKYVLHGGFIPAQKQENDAFFTETLKETPKRTKILLVYFAKEPDRVALNRAEDVEQFSKNSGTRELSFEVANNRSFPEQIEKADIIYLHGGHTGKLLNELRKFKNLEELFMGKIIAGDSAGANVLCAAFYSLRIGAGEGLSIIPIKIICHFSEENKDKMRQIKPNLETLFLRELQFKVFVL